MLKSKSKVETWKSLQVGTWYRIGNYKENMICKIVQHPDLPIYHVVCYWDAHSLFAGSLSECKKWISERRIKINVED